MFYQRFEIAFSIVVLKLELRASANMTGEILFIKLNI